MSGRLPIEDHEGTICETVTTDQFVIIRSPTGTGKSTQIPLFLMRMEEIAGRGRIGVTEPRKKATVWVAEYVAAQQGEAVGERVGYQIRFDRQVRPATELKFMTVGILIQELKRDRDLRAYSIIVVDEAHERSVEIDIIVTILKSLAVRRPDLKVIILSATMDVEKFSSHLHGAPVISIPGRQYPVEVIYRPVTLPQDEHKWAAVYTDAAAQIVREIHETRGPGGIAIFMPGMSDIELTLAAIQALNLTGLELFVAHSEMSSEEMDRIHDKYPGKRVVIVSTNILETSITVDGLVYAIDSGYIKQSGYNTLRGLSSLLREEHSQMGCDQRKGRVGRTETGFCYRLYSEANFDSRPMYTLPEILRTDLTPVILTLKALGIHNPQKFDFMDRPESAAIQNALETLAKLGALRSEGSLTTLGSLMAKLPIEPQYVAMITAADSRGCLDEIITVVSIMALGRLFVRPLDKKEQADRAKLRFVVAGSDYLTGLKAWNAFIAKNRSRTWAIENFLNYHLLCEVDLLRAQLISELTENGFEITSNPDPELIAKCITAGLVQNVCSRNGSNRLMYKNGENDVMIFPGSVVRGSSPRMFVCSQICNNGDRTYAHEVQVIPPEWLYEMAPHLCVNEIDVSKLTYNAATDVYSVVTRVHFDDLDRVCTIATKSYPEDPDHHNMKWLYARSKAWERFLEVNQETLCQPSSLRDFEPDEPQVIVEADDTPEHPCVEILGYPYVRYGQGADGTTGYLRGFTRHQPTATQYTNQAKKTWQKSVPKQVR